MSSSKKVFVLGAGFTKAFFPGAPLLKDNYDTSSLMQRFEKFPHALRALELETKTAPSGQIDIERIMTRLDGGMPYDFEQGVNDEHSLLLSAIKKAFMDRLEVAKRGVQYNEQMKAFAKFCIENKITCVTFNYDDIFDEALWSHEQSQYWHPDMGYGFFCRPSELCLGEASIFNSHTSMHLLKLHGSVNWRIKRGSLRPYAIDAVVHHQSWYPKFPRSVDYDEADILLHLEPDPFIVPPVLVKTAIVQQPILRVIWTLAYQTLSQAEEVSFIGYSLPITDIAASFLFSEALNHLPPSQIKVVNKSDTVREAYLRVFPDLNEGQFYIRDALDWCSQLTGR